MRYKIGSLTYELLDDICLAVQSSQAIIANLPNTHVESLGPFLELIQTQQSLLPSQGSKNWLSVEKYRALLNVKQQSKVWLDTGAGEQGFISIPQLQDDANSRTNLMLCVKRAAIKSGFSNDHAGQFSAAVNEMYSNAIEHSENAESGYVAFLSEPGKFEFVVADSGIGILRSLKSNPLYASLTNSGSALEMALKEGVSRHYVEKGHGFGFRQLLVGLANISNYIRFRSGDYGRIIQRGKNGAIEGTTIQLSNIEGFFCSVVFEVAGKRSAQVS